ncbi:hypothetical protein AVEN_141280-1 [Araneus ventricosus]|uniref:Uncharacterized protein n=1 Tax=Araneus ventricosus TaxID=182803 RepID=A0A4Y2UN96_ARAVE|nr:hypothetical protein AVEN_141280-1 [Araneus ventricosus]
MRTPSITRENEDVETFVHCFSQPFPTMSICSDLALKADANCHMYQELGCKGISKILGVHFGNVKFKRFCAAKLSDEDLNMFELSPCPLLLLNKQGMRNETKSLLFSAFRPTDVDTVRG